MEKENQEKLWTAPLRNLRIGWSRKRLYNAIHSGDAAEVAKILSRGCNPNFRTHDGKTPLSLALEYDHSMIFQMLLAHGAKMGLEPGEDGTFEKICSHPDRKWGRIASRHIDIAKTQPQVMMEMARIALKNGRHVLACAILWRTHLNYPADVWKPLASGLPRIRLKFGKLRHQRFIRAFVELGLEHLPTTQYQESILHVVLRAGLCDLVPRFTHDRNRLLSRGQGGTIPLLLAAELELASLYPHLCIKQAVNGSVTDNELFEALTHSWESESRVESCLLAGADPDGTFENVKMLNWALFMGKFTEAAMLVCLGAVPAPTDGEKFPPLARSIAGGSIGMTELLLWLGCDPHVNGDQYVFTYPHMNLSSKRNGVPLLDKLLRSGLDINQQAWTEETALTLAASRGDVELIEALVKRGANINLSSASGFTPLLWAVLGGHEQAALRLIELGADPMQKDKDGRTALDMAMSKHLDKFSKELRRVGLSDSYSVPPEWESEVRELQYDFFVSYRLYRFADAAHELARELRQRGCSVFFDLDSPELASSSSHGERDRIPIQILKRVLYIAARSSSCTLFFESTLEMVVDAQTGESKTAFSWQRFEKLYSNNFQMVYGLPASWQMDDLASSAKEARQARGSVSGAPT
jgi:ankyrin repeat protein